MHHAVETDLATVISHIIQTRKRREWDPILENVRNWIPRVKADPSRETIATVLEVK